MGRFTAYDQNGRMVADFDKSDYDFLCRYGRTPEEVLDENAKLRELVRDFASYRHFDCRHCGYKEQCKARQTNCYKVFVGLFDRARELGIEVDG